MTSLQKTKKQDLRHAEKNRSFAPKSGFIQYLYQISTQSVRGFRVYSHIHEARNDGSFAKLQTYRIPIVYAPNPHFSPFTFHFSPVTLAEKPPFSLILGRWNTDCKSIRGSSHHFPTFFRNFVPIELGGTDVFVLASHK